MAEFCGLDLGLPLRPYGCDYLEYQTKRSPEQSLKEFHKLILSRSDLAFDRCDDKYITRFLMARKYRLEESFQLFVNYHLFRRRNPHLYERLSALDVLIQQALRDGFPGVLDSRDRKGRTILVFLASRWRHNHYSLINIYRALLLTLEYLIDDYLNQDRGFVVIVDWTEFSFKNSASLSPRVLKTLIDGLQDCFPAKIKGVHFINQPWYVEAVLSITKPFLKDKSKNKIFLHGNNVGTLHDYVSRDILPPELGGEGPSLNPMSWTQKLIDGALKEVNLPDTPEIDVKDNSIIT